MSIAIQMLAREQVSNSCCNVESDGEELSAKSIRLFRVRFVEAPVACGRGLYILHLCRELQNELGLLRKLSINHLGIPRQLQELLDKIRNLLLSPGFGKLKELEPSQHQKVQI